MHSSAPKGLSLEILPNGAWRNATARYHVLDDGLIAPLAALFGRLTTVADFGCGSGLYVDALTEHGISIAGYDGNPATRYRYADLSLPVIANCGWVLSLEVGEHIPPEHEQTFIGNPAVWHAVGQAVEVSHQSSSSLSSIRPRGSSNWRRVNSGCSSVLSDGSSRSEWASSPVNDRPLPAEYATGTPS